MRRLIRKDDPEPTDLFWAIRGGGGKFGIVTQFVFRLHPVGPEVLSGLVVYPFEQARAVLTRYREFFDTIPDDLCVWAVLRRAPPLPFLPESGHGREVVIEYAGRLPSPQCEVFIGLLAGEANRVAADATAYAHRDVKFVLNVHGRWHERGNLFHLNQNIKPSV